MSTIQDNNENKNNDVSSSIEEAAIIKGKGDEETQVDGNSVKSNVDDDADTAKVVVVVSDVSEQLNQQLQISSDNDDNHGTNHDISSSITGNNNTSSNNNTMDSMYHTMQQLVVLISSLQYDNENKNNITGTLTSYRSISHYSIIPNELQQIYDTIIHQTTIIYNTITKYTLMQQLVVVNTNTSTATTSKSTNDGSDVAILSIVQDLVHACRILVACTMTIFNNNNNSNSNNNNNTCISTASSNNTSLGCCKAVCVHTKKAIRNIITSVVQLFKLFIQDNNNNTNTNNNTTLIDPAQCTGVVWDACQYIITYKKLPYGNRNAIRRDILTYKLDCNDTIQEFQLLYEQSQEYYTNKKNNNNDENNDIDIDIDELYNMNELNIILPCIYILKCSRGTINIVLTIIDLIGMSIYTNNNNNTSLPDNKQSNMKDNDNDTNNTTTNVPTTSNKLKLHWIAQLYDLICIVGYGVTDFGTVLYPPLQITNNNNTNNSDNNTVSVQTELRKQSNAIQNVLQYVTANIIPMYDIGTSNIELIQTIQSACIKRTNEVLDAISNQQ